MLNILLWILLIVVALFVVPKFGVSPLISGGVVLALILGVIIFPMFSNRGLSIVGVGEGRFNVDNLGANIDGVEYVYRGHLLHYWSEAAIISCDRTQFVEGFDLPLNLCRSGHTFELYFGDVVEDDPSPAKVDFVYEEPTDNTARLTVIATIEDRRFTHQYSAIAQPWTAKGFKVTKTGNVNDFNSDVVFKFIGESPAGYSLNVLGFSVRAVGTNVVLKWCENEGRTVPFNFWSESRCGTLPVITPVPTSIVVTTTAPPATTPPPVDTRFTPPPDTFPPGPLPIPAPSGVCGPTLILLAMVAVPLVGKKWLKSSKD